METIFEAGFLGERAILNEAAGITKKHRVAKNVLIAVGIVIMLMIPVLLYFDPNDSFAYTYVFLGAFYTIYAFFYTDICAAAMRRNNAKNPGAGLVKYSFSDTSFSVQSTVASSTLNYTAIERVVETHAAFFLFVNKISSYPVPKNSFKKGDSAEFAGFINSKTYLPVERSNYSAKNNLIKKIISIAVVLIYIVLCFCLSGFLKTSAQVFSVNDNYSITLTREFVQEADNDTSFTAHSDDISVFVTEYELNEIKEYFQTEATDISEFLELEITDILNRCEGSKLTGSKGILDNGVVYFFYSYTVDDIKYVYCNTSVISKDSYYNTEFCCFEDDFERVESRILDLAGTISVK